MSKGFVIGGDCGTSGSKASAIDFDGSPIHTVFVSHEHVQGLARGVKEIDPWELRRSATMAVQQLMEYMVSNGYSPADCKAIAFGGAMHGLVLLDGHGNTGPNVVCWNDERGEDQGLRWTSMLELPIPLRFTGSRFSDWKTRDKSGFVPKRVMTPASFITSLGCGGVTGMLACDASGMYGYQLNPYCINGANIEKAEPGFLDMVPKVFHFGECVGRTTKDGAKLFGIPEGTPWGAGGGDQMLGAIGSGVCDAGVLKLELGTSIVANISGLPVVTGHRGLVEAMNSSLGLPHSMCCVSNGMDAYEKLVAFVRTIRSGDKSEIFSFLAESARGVKAGSDGLLVQSFFTSEGSLLQPAGAFASLLNLTAGNFTIGHFARAFMEAPILILREAIKKMVGGGEISKVVLAGGGANDSMLPQVVADVLGLKTFVSADVEAVARGAAINALVVAKRLSREDVDVSDLVAQLALTGDVILPTQGVSEVYDQVCRRFFTAELLMRGVNFSLTAS